MPALVVGGGPPVSDCVSYTTTLDCGGVATPHDEDMSVERFAIGPEAWMPAVHVTRLRMNGTG